MAAAREVFTEVGYEASAVRADQTLPPRRNRASLLCAYVPGGPPGSWPLAVSTMFHTSGER